MDKVQINALKDKVMTSGRYLEKVFETGFETYEQFQSFCNMCENHVNMCNAYCKKIRPSVPFIQRKQYKEYDNFRTGCAWSVEIINDTISRSPLDKNPMPGHLFELHPVNEVNTKGQ